MPQRLASSSLESSDGCRGIFFSLEFFSVKKYEWMNEWRKEWVNEGRTNRIVMHQLRCGVNIYFKYINIWIPTQILPTMLLLASASAFDCCHHRYHRCCWCWRFAYNIYIHTCIYVCLYVLVLLFQQFTLEIMCEYLINIIFSDKQRKCLYKKYLNIYFMQAATTTLVEMCLFITLVVCDNVVVVVVFVGCLAQVHSFTPFNSGLQQ